MSPQAPRKKNHAKNNAEKSTKKDQKDSNKHRLQSNENKPSPSERSILITGASTGIGNATTKHLDQLGFRVYAGVRTEEDALKIERECSNRVFPVFLDITDPQSTRAAFEDISRDLDKSGLYGLINNAGICVGGPLEILPISALRQQFNINVFGQIAVTQMFLPLIRVAQQRGYEPRIINISSISGLYSMPYAGAYPGSKFALEALSDALRLELKPWKIHVSLIEPGAIKTPIWEKSRDQAEKLMARVPQEKRARYDAMMERVKELTTQAGDKGLEPIEVAHKIAQALTTPRPKIRYLVGRDAKIRHLIGLLPDWLQDKLMARYIGIPSTPPSEITPEITTETTKTKGSE